MGNAEQPEGKEKTTRQPSLAARGERRRIERRLQQAGIFCHPEVSLQYQTLAKRPVIRGVESGGAAKDIGRYVTFCDEKGDRLAWLQPIDSVAVNGRHAVVIAPSVVSVEVFRIRNTYDVLIAKHDAVPVPQGRPGRIEVRVLFRGRQGHLPLDLTGDDKRVAGQIVPEFFNRAGERIEIPSEFAGVLKAAVLGANCLGCTHQHYLTAPKVAAVVANAGPGNVAEGPSVDPAPEEHAATV